MHSIWIQASILTFLSNLLLSHQTAQDTKLSIIWKWRALDKKIDYSSEEVKNLAIAQGLYIPSNVLLICADYHEATQRLFVSGPLFKEGFPATLFEVTRGQGLLRPFPNWPSYVNNRISCEDIFSVFRIQIDKCGLMWVLDSGRSGMLLSSELICQPKILVYDLNNGDRLVAQHIIPQGVVTDRSRLTTIITESYASDCSDSIAYIADGNDHALVVFDLAKETSWKFNNALFWPYPMPDQFLSGVIGLALDPPTVPDRKLYFHSFSSVKESWVPVRIVKNKTLSENVFATRGNFQVSPGDRKGISTVEVVTDDGILIYALLSNEIACWNTKTPYTAENQHIIWKDDENFIFLSGMKLKGNSLLLTSCRFQEYSAGIANGTYVTTRVMVIEDVKRLLYNTPCSSTYSQSSTQTTSNYIRDEIQTSLNPSTSIPNRASNNFFQTNYVRSGIQSLENPSTSTLSWNRALNDASYSYSRAGYENGRRNYFYGPYNPVLNEESNQEYYMYY